eukprot:1058383-Pleurochrysis_carterae.AAC.1
MGAQQLPPLFRSMREWSIQSSCAAAVGKAGCEIVIQFDQLVVADAHVSVVSLGVDPFDETEKEWYVPAPFEEWDAARTYTEIVVKDDSQVDAACAPARRLADAGAGAQ